MKKKFTLLILVAACLAGNGRKVVGQTYWGNGCGCGNSYLTTNVSSSEELGLKIDGDRYMYYFTGVSSGSSTVPTDHNGVTSNYAGSSGTYYTGGYWYYFYYTSSSYGVSPVYYNNTVHRGAINYPVSDCGYSTSSPLPVGHTDAISGHNHTPIQVNVQGGSIYTPLHFLYFRYENPTWEHKYYSYNSSTQNWTAASTSQTNVVTGNIVIEGGKSVRLTAAAPDNAISAISGLTNPNLVLPVNYYLRFDNTYTGLHSVLLPLTNPAAEQTATYLTINNAAKGLGFFNGTNSSNSVTLNKGYLFLGDNGTAQNYTVALNGTGFIENYWRDVDVEDYHNGIASHDVYINFNSFDLNSQKLYISNSNECKRIYFNQAFSPLDIQSANGGLYIGKYGAGTTGLHGGGGHVKFNAAVTLGTSTNVVSAPVEIYGDSVVFNSTYTYYGTDSIHYIFAHGDCSDGDILFKGGVSVTKSKNDKTQWTAERDIIARSTVVNTVPSDSVTTNWQAGRDILTYDDVQFNNNGKGKTFWEAGHNITTTGGSTGIDFNITNNAETEWWAGTDITTNNVVDFNMNNTVAKKTNWHAGNDIHILNDVTFTHTGPGRTEWYAVNDIKADNCINTITFTHGDHFDSSGDTYWIADNGEIEIYPDVIITKTNTSNAAGAATGHTAWKAGSHIKTHNDITYVESNVLHGDGVRWEAGLDGTGNIEVDDYCQPVTIDFSNTVGSHQSFMEWWAQDNIFVRSTQTTKMIINFTNRTIDPNMSTNYMLWHAHAHDIDITRANITFTTTGTNSSGYTKWYAQENIKMLNSKIDFINDGVVTANNNTDWHAAEVDIDANNTPITFTNNGEGWTHWYADNDILLHDNSPTTFTDAASTNFLWLEAYRDFRTGNGSPLLINHNSPDHVPLLPSDTAYIKLEATTRNIWTQSSVDIINDGIGNRTDIYAGQDIRIDSTFTYDATNPAGIEHVKLRANTGDIIVNPGNSATGDIVHPDLNSWRATNWCDASRAAVNFTLAGAGYTEWWAAHNIIATDTIHFHYDNTGHKVGDILLHAHDNNIDLRRPFKVDIDTASLVRLEALAEVSLIRNNKHSARPSTSPYYYGLEEPVSGLNAIDLQSAADLLHDSYGNIRTSDSVVINRTFAEAAQGLTQIDAYNDIQTAKFDFTSLNTAGDLTDITSRKGDIWLGYSWKNPAECPPGDNHPTDVSLDENKFIYRVPVATTGGKLNILSGYADATATDKYAGGNIYFTHIIDSLGKGGTYETELSIPFSNMFICSAGLYGNDYERAGIIGGVARCQSTGTYPLKCDNPGLVHIGNNGDLLVNAGTRGNIIFNNGAYLQFQNGTGDAKFLTQWGDIDMRHPFDVDSMQGDVLFYANSLLSNKTQFNGLICSCEEKRNNVYLQDFSYNPATGASGSVFIGADNNIKIQYGGLNVSSPTARDPFFNTSGYTNEHCGANFHCDADTTINQARDLILNFDKDASGANITSGGFAAVASDLIDIYKNTVYHGGQGSGMGPVPGYTTLHGESVAGYGLYIKTQANKKNWNISDFMVDHQSNPNVGAACMDDGCTLANSFLHKVARVTFHADARIYTQNQRSLITSPVLETYGNLDLNTNLGAGSKTLITIRTDSLIMHDSLIIDGPRTAFSTWSGLRRDMPVFKLGHQRFTPPYAGNAFTPADYCANCYTSEKDELAKNISSPYHHLDTIYVTYRNGASVPRLHTLVADHTVLSFLTDSFDHVHGAPTIHAKFYTDTFKIRNHVELFAKDNNTHDGHFELVSEPQMSSKDYAGIYARHLHLEPIAPSCSGFAYSQFWPLFRAIDIIPTATIGGFGWIHSDVHVSIGANLFPGYASLRYDGNCYEQKAGVLRMNDLRIDKGANVKISIGGNRSDIGEDYDCYEGDTKYEMGRYADCLDVDSLTIYGETPIEVIVRPGGIDLSPGEERCWPILHYNKVQKGVLNHLALKKATLTSKDHPSITDTHYLHLEFDTVCHVVSLCIGVPSYTPPTYSVTIPSVPGVTTNPPTGKHYVSGYNDFRFTAVYETPTRQPYLVKITPRMTDEEVLTGTLNANGEYEYIIHQVTKHIEVLFGPDFQANESVDGVAVWSHNEKLYIKVPREDIASIYSITGQLVKRIEVPEGNTTVPMIRGVYVVTLKDRSVHKVIIK
jgi:hypothetical protein